MTALNKRVICRALFAVICFFAELHEARAGEALFYDEPANSQQWLDLLHYQKGRSLVDKKEAFFLSDVGYKDPKKELEATIEAFKDPDAQGDEHAVCRFPARMDFILKNMPYKRADFVKTECKKFEEFKVLAPMDEVYLVFAAENNQTSATAMGHLFLSFMGDSEGVVRRHAFSFFATEVDYESAEFYYRALFDSIDGVYALSPYYKKRDDYLINDGRIVWEIKLLLSEEQRGFLHKHLWELKQQKMHYSFIAHNCGTASINLLKLVYPEMDLDAKKLFDTPIDYVLRFKDEDKIEKVNFIKDDVAEKPKGLDLLKAKPSSKVSDAYRYFDK
ncbi:MAG: DUF4105 domain-containing protein, partial [Lactobacillus sp.]|nr:DUF4105 domain-containing protein [Lactobacillus sp.]